MASGYFIGFFATLDQIARALQQLAPETFTPVYESLLHEYLDRDEYSTSRDEYPDREELTERLYPTVERELGRYGNNVLLTNRRNMLGYYIYRPLRLDNFRQALNLSSRFFNQFSSIFGRGSKFIEQLEIFRDPTSTHTIIYGIEFSNRSIDSIRSTFAPVLQIDGELKVIYIAPITATIVGYDFRDIIKLKKISAYDFIDLLQEYRDRLTRYVREHNLDDIVFHEI